MGSDDVVENIAEENNPGLYLLGKIGAGNEFYTSAVCIRKRWSTPDFKTRVTQSQFDLVDLINDQPT